MKSRITILFLAALVLSSFIYPQTGPFPKTERELANKKNIENAAPRNNPLFNEPSNLYNSSEIQASISKAYAAEPGKTSSYVPGEYYVEGFEDGAIPSDWQARSVSGSVQWTTSDKSEYIGSRSAFIDREFGLNGIDWLITPQYSAALDDSLTFFISPYYTNLSPDTLRVLVSIENEVPADNAALDAAFSDTLFVIAVDTLNYGWYRYSVSLDKYAGKQIYIGFKEYNNAGCRLFLDEVCIGKTPAADIAYSSPYHKDFLKTGENAGIWAYFANKGYATQSFNITCEIPDAGYSSSQYISNLKPGDRVQVLFNWVPSKAGSYQISVRSTLAGDEHPDNDTYTGIINAVGVLPIAQWHKEKDLNTGKLRMGVAPYIIKTGDESQPYAGGVFVFGGTRINNTAVDSIWKYDMNARSWSPMNAHLPTTLQQFRSVQIEGKIYIPGGYNGSAASSLLYIYDIENDTITKGANLLEAALAYSIGVYGDSLIYVIGGKDAAYYPTTNVQIYNVKTDTWAYGSPMILARNSAAGSIAGNKIVIAGGTNVNGSVYYSSAEIGVIDPANPYVITWTLDKYPGGMTCGMSAGSWYAKNNKYVFFSGGFHTEDMSGFSSTYETWAYDVQYDKWLGGPYKITAMEQASDMVPIVRNDSVFMAVMGGYNYGDKFANEWMYIGKYEPLSKDGKDVAAVSVILPDTIFANYPAILKAAFINRQLTTQTFDVTMEITPGGYTSTKTISPLVFGSTAQVQFDPWTPAVGGNYTVKVYSSLTDDEDKANDTLTIIAHAQKVDINANQVKRDMLVYPLTETALVAYFINKGEQSQTFNATMEIAQSAYSSIKSVTNLAAGDTAAVAFDGWTPVASGNYTVKTYSSLAADENKVNDTLTVGIHVQKVDVELSGINIDAPTFAMSGTTPQATFLNNGEQKQTFNVIMKIPQSSYSSLKVVKDLLPGNSIVVSFNSWTPAVSGSYAVEVYSSLAIDEDKTNDTLKIIAHVEKTDNSSRMINIESPAYTSEEIAPKALFENKGTQPQTFKVSMAITPGDYYSERTVTNLAVNGLLEVEFDSWIPAEAGLYAVKVYSETAIDEDKSNDTLKTKVYVLDELNAGDWHSEKLIPNYYDNKTAASYTMRYAAGDSSFIFIISPNTNVAGSEVDSSYAYNTAKQKWMYKQSLDVDLQNVQAAYVNGKIYVPGGLTYNNASSDKLFVYDPIRNKWAEETKMPEASAFHGLGVYGDSLLYVIGGAGITEDTVVLHDNARVYNVKSKIWKTSSAFEGEFKKGNTGGIIKNKIVLAGGLEYNSDVYSDQVVIGEIDTLNPYNVVWGTAVNPLGPIYGMASAACNSKQGSYVIFTGGRKKDGLISPITLAYDAEENKWYRGPDANIRSSLSSGITIARNDSLYFAALGGENNKNLAGLNQWLYLGEAIRDTNIIGVNDKPLGPITYSLSQNYPNPFNPSTIIKYSVAQPEQVELKIYNMLGQEVITLVNELKSAGVYEVRFNAAGLNLSSGVYLYRIKAGSFVQTKKLMLIK